MRYFRGLAAFTTHRAVPVGVAVATTIGLGVVAPTVTASPALAETSVTFGYTGSEQTFTVPDGVTSLHIVAIGAPGGTGGSRAGFTANGGPGGNGGTVTADIPVTPGSTLYVEVGGPGADGVSWGPFNPMFESGYRPLGGFNGGGGASWGNDAGSGGGGGGASDVRTCLRAPGQPTWGNHLPICANGSDQRLVVAAGGGGGGGGGGYADNTGSAPGGQGGAGNGQDGTDGAYLAASGGTAAAPHGSGGTLTAGGVGGNLFGLFSESGSLGQGGFGYGGGPPSGGGGGGGGGYYGGGAGGQAFAAGGGGSGGGSNFVTPAATQSSSGVAATNQPSVKIAYASVTYGWAGFFPPVDNPPTVNTLQGW